MDRLLYLLARGVIGLLQAMPLALVARLGRIGGMIFYWCDARHRTVARKNLARCFPEKSENEIRVLTRENFLRIGENFACAIKTASLSIFEISKILQVVGAEKVYPLAEQKPRNHILAVGHFGNFELYAHCGSYAPHHKFATTYRGLRQPSLNRILQDLREKSGCLFFERRREGAALKAALNEGGLLLGLLADQHAGDKGLRLPFFGQDCSTSAAPAIFALRYNCSLNTAVCFRIAPGRWRIEVGDPIATHENGQPRTPASIMLEVNRAFETAIRRDPANWFWVHNRWKPSLKQKQQAAILAATTTNDLE
jgi:KDO2-lipid IV(A) lauroyltransferase